MDTNVTLVLYAVRNNKGEFFRAKGYNGSGSTWVSDINKAKIYGKTGGARSVVTWFANNYPKYPTLELLKLTITGVEVMDETQRVQKAKDKKAKELANREAYRAKQELKDAQEAVARANAKLKKLTKNG